jgi:hypothetical protein
MFAYRRPHRTISNFYSELSNNPSKEPQSATWGAWKPKSSTEYAFGIMLNLTLPLVHVTKFNNKYFLHNGYHRVYGAKKAGATHIPAILRKLQMRKTRVYGMMAAHSGWIY